MRTNKSSEFLMPRPRRCEDGNRIRRQDRQGERAPQDCRRRREQTTFSERLNPECAAEVDETIAEIVRPKLCRPRSPTDADRDRQYDPEKATALPIPTAPDAVQHVHLGPCGLTQNENYRC